MSENDEPNESRLGRTLALWIVGPIVVLVIGAVALMRHPPRALWLDMLTTEFRQQTGFGLEIGGRASLRLWPQGVLDIRDVKIRRPSAITARGGIVADAIRITVRFNAADWLRGRRAITTLDIEKPTVTLFDADLRQLRSASGAGTQGTRIETVTVKDAYVSYHTRPANPAFSASSFEATLSDVGHGRIGRLDGRFMWHDARVTMRASMRRTGAGRSSLALDLAAPTAKLAFKGTAFDDATTRIEGEADIRITALEAFGRWLDIDHGPDHPAFSGPATIAGPIALSTKQVWFKGAEIATGIAAGKVDVAIDMRGTRPRITGEAAWNHLDLTPFTAPKPTLAAHALAPAAARSALAAVTIPSAWQGLDAYLDTLGQPGASRALAAEARPVTPPPVPVKSPFGPLTLDFGRLKALDMAVLQTTAKLLLAGAEIRDVTLDSRLEDGRLSLDVTQATFAGGPWSAKLAVDARTSTPEHALTIKGEQVDVRQLLDRAGAPAALEGRGNFNADLSARGRKFDAVLETLSGKAAIDLGKGRLIGFDLKAVLNQWWRKWTYDQRRTTPFNKLHARVRLDKGVVRTIGPATLRGRHVEVDSNGTVSLAGRRLDQRVRARLAPPPSHLPIPVRIAGRWSEPSVSLDFGLFSLAPGRYEMPFSPRQDAVAGRLRGFTPGDDSALPAELRDKISRALGDPAQAQKIPPKLREQLGRLVE